MKGNLVTVLFGCIIVIFAPPEAVDNNFKAIAAFVGLVALMILGAHWYVSYIDRAA